MKLLMTFAVIGGILLAESNARPLSKNGDLDSTVRGDDDIPPPRPYNYSYEIDNNGVVTSVQGNPAVTPVGQPSMSVQGGYTYVTPDGMEINVNYTANDEEGFIPAAGQASSSPVVGSFHEDR